MVDTVLYFEGEKSAMYRVLRGVKNRFGSTNEIGVFEMKDNGLHEVENPSQVMLSDRPLDAAGSVVVCSMEGTRPILTEIQALVCQSNFNLPRRTSVGIDYNRVNLLMAVLEKRAGILIAGNDAYVNLAGGMKLNDTAIDLGIVVALVSSFKNVPVDPHTIILGEVGLAGEIRGVVNIAQRVNEAVKMGFSKCYIPKSNFDKSMDKLPIEIESVSTLMEAISKIF